MFLKKSKPLKISPWKQNLDHALWFVENYLPKAKGRATRKDLFISFFNAKGMKHIQKLASLRPNSLSPSLMNKKFSFSFESLALSSLKFLKQLGLTK